MSFPTLVYGDEGLFYGDETTAKRHMLGTVGVAPDGRRYVYCEMGGVVGAAARLYQSEANATSAILAENPTAAAAAAATSVSVDVTSAPTADDFTDGYLVDETNGHVYRVRSNTTADPTVVVLDNDNGLVTDLATGDVVALYKSPYKDVIIHDSPPTAPCVGWDVQGIAANSFGWLQTFGITAALIDGTVVVGDAVRSSEDDDGAVALFDADEAAVADQGIVGYCLEIGADTTVGTIFARL